MISNGIPCSIVELLQRLEIMHQLSVDGMGAFLKHKLVVCSEKMGDSMR